jgi:hypothetical protein
MRIDNVPVLVDVRGPSPGEAVVLNNGPATAYYGASASLAEAHSSSLAQGATVTLTAPTWFIVANPANGFPVAPANIDVRQIDAQPETAESVATVDEATVRRLARPQVSAARGTIYEEGTYPLKAANGTTNIGTGGKTSRKRFRITAHGTADFRLWFGNFTRGGLTGGPNDIIVGATVEDPGTGDPIAVTINGESLKRCAPFGLIPSEPRSGSGITLAINATTTRRHRTVSRHTASTRPAR